VGLVSLSPGQIREQPLADDDALRGLADALRQSLRYYHRLPESARFRYGELTYTAREMEASTALLLDLVVRLSPEEAVAAIRERFLFFESRNERGAAFFTGYYEPILPGSLAQTERFRTPLFGVPGDLLSLDLAPYVDAGLLPEELRHRSLRGKVAGKKVVPYDTRDQIAFGGSLAGRAEALAWVADDIELFFVQVQGSCLVRLEDGTLLRLNYSDQNGMPYRAIGKLLRDRIPPERMALQSLKGYLREHPGEVREILAYNPSYTFFRQVKEGPLGNIAVPLTAGRSVAMDAHLLPKGGVVWFETTLPQPGAGREEGGGVPVRRFGVVQDTGGAITGHGRVDIFWGSGAAAERLAGPLKNAGRVFLLVAKKEFLAPPQPQP
jgi:membrane-bound lytic murein transglycosylase A